MLLTILSYMYLILSGQRPRVFLVVVALSLSLSLSLPCPPHCLNACILLPSQLYIHNMLLLQNRLGNISTRTRNIS